MAGKFISMHITKQIIKLSENQETKQGIEHALHISQNLKTTIYGF